MARLETRIEGNSDSLVSAMNKGQKSVQGVSASFDKATAAVAAWDAAARRNAANPGLARQLAMTNGLIKQAEVNMKNLGKQMQLVQNPSFSFGVGANPNALPRLSQDLGRVTQSYRGANGVAMEFNRIIQDAPFDIMGVGNNITQLASNFSVLQRQAGSTGAALKATFTSLLSTGNLVALGISAVVTGWTLWERHAQKARKATKDLEDGTKTYIETLEGVQRASADGQVNAIKETSKLDLLYRASQDLNLSYEERKKHADALISQHPDIFKNHTSEAIVAGEAADAYNKLAVSLIATAKAQANMNKVAENSITVLNRALQANDIGQQLAKVRKERIEAQRAAEGMNTGPNAYGAENPLSSMAQSKAEALLTKELGLRQQIIGLNQENGKTLQENAILENSVIELIKDGADISGKTSGNLKDSKKTLSDTLDLMNQLQGTLMSDYDRKVFDINNRYADIFKQIHKIGDASRKADAFGLATQAKNLEILRAETEKYIGVVGGLKPTNTVTMSGGPAGSTTLPRLEAESARINKHVAIKLGDEITREVGKAIIRGVGSGIKDIANSIDGLGSNFHEVFTNAFGKLTGSITGILGDALGRSLGESITKRFEDGADLGALGTKTGQAIVFGAQLAGKALGSMISPTNSVGQGIAGGISGAASGIAAGSAIGGATGGIVGAAIGGLIGLVSGIFGSSKAKKQERLQEQALAEQRKQTKLLERQNSLGWMANITGQMTSSGIVTGTDRTSTGELVARVSGRDLDFIYQRRNG